MRFATSWGLSVLWSREHARLRERLARIRSMLESLQVAAAMMLQISISTLRVLCPLVTQTSLARGVPSHARIWAPRRPGHDATGVPKNAQARAPQEGTCVRDATGTTADALNFRHFAAW